MKTLIKSSQIPLYQQVVEWIRESIYSGELVEDDRIPSEFQIMDMLEVSRGTVKKAVDQLVREGVLVQVQGKGTGWNQPIASWLKSSESTRGRIFCFLNAFALLVMKK